MVVYCVNHLLISGILTVLKIRLAVNEVNMPAVKGIVTHLTNYQNGTSLSSSGSIITEAPFNSDVVGS